MLLSSMLDMTGGHAGICSWLCSQRCDPAERDMEGTTAFSQAVCGGGRNAPQTVLPSLFQGAPCLTHQFFMDTADDKGLTLWHVAAVTDATPALRWLVEHAEPGIPQLRNVDTLLAATKEGNVQAASLLVELNAEIGLLTPGSPRDWAAALLLPKLQSLFWSRRDENADAAWAARWHAYKCAEGL